MKKSFVIVHVTNRNVDMKTLLSLTLIFVGFVAFAAGPKFEIGDKASHTSVKMVGVSGDKMSLDDAMKENGVVLIFSCNTCPFVKKWEGRYNGLKKWADDHGVGMVVVNSNYQKRDGDDSLEAMKEHAKVHGYQFPYLVDENSLLANAYGGQTTPHVFLFNKNFELVYKGAIDDNFDEASAVKSPYLKTAIEDLSEGKKIALAETKPVGCSIKRKID